MRTTLGVMLLCALVLAAPAGAAIIKTTLTTTTAKPLVDQPWRYTVTVRNAAGTPLRAQVKLQLLLGETVVGCWKGGAMVQCTGASAGTWIAFRGKRTGILRFPAQSVGVTLTFQAIVKVEGRTRKLRAPVTVQPAPLPLTRRHTSAREVEPPVEAA